MKSNIKKILALILMASVLVFSFAACDFPVENGDQPLAGADSVKFFAFEERDDGTYAIVGLSAEGKQEKTLTVPLKYNDANVSVIASGAFSGGVVEKVIITKDTNVRLIENGAFSDAGELSALYIYFADAELILPPADFSGTSDDFTIYVPDGSYYDVDYFWSAVPGIKDMIQFMGE